MREKEGGRERERKRGKGYNNSDTCLLNKLHIHTFIISRIYATLQNRSVT